MTKTTRIGIMSLVVIVAGIVIATRNGGGRVVDTRIAFAQCLAQKEVTFYGAFWCPHCNSQKDMFGKKATKELPYVECSTADAKSQTLVCQEAGVTNYPTWKFVDGTTITGEQTFEKLSALSGCPVPVGYEEEPVAELPQDAVVAGQPETNVANDDASQTPAEITQ